MGNLSIINLKNKQTKKRRMDTVSASNVNSTTTIKKPANNEYRTISLFYINGIKRNRKPSIAAFVFSRFALI